MKIHLLCLMAADLDYDLLPHWINHYKKLDINTYTVFLHKEQSKKHGYYCANLLKQNGFTVFWILDNGVKDIYCEPLRTKCFKQICNSIPSHEFILSVDSDEFQDWPDSIEKCMDYGNVSIMEGVLIDYFNVENPLKDCLPNVPIETQYPDSHASIEKALCNDPAIQRMVTRKICCHLNEIPIDFNGSHEIKPGTKKIYRSRGVLHVKHYKWRATTKERLLTKPWYNAEKVKTILTGFGV